MQPPFGRRRVEQAIHAHRAGEIHFGAAQGKVAHRQTASLSVQADIGRQLHFHAPLGQAVAAGREQHRQTLEIHPAEILAEGEIGVELEPAVHRWLSGMVFERQLDGHRLAGRHFAHGEIDPLHPVRLPFLAVVITQIEIAHLQPGDLELKARPGCLFLALGGGFHFRRSAARLRQAGPVGMPFGVFFQVDRQIVGHQGVHRDAPLQQGHEGHFHVELLDLGQGFVETGRRPHGHVGELEPHPGKDRPVDGRPQGERMPGLLLKGLFHFVAHLVGVEQHQGRRHGHHREQHQATENTENPLEGFHADPPLSIVAGRTRASTRAPTTNSIKIARIPVRALPVSTPTAPTSSGPITAANLPSML